MRWAKRNNFGFSFVELLVVIVIIGVLSSLGVVGFQQAIAKTRIADASHNVSAFMERVANDTRRLADTLCVSKASNNKLYAYKSSCKSSSKGTPIDSLELVKPVVFINAKNDGLGATTNWYSNSPSGATFAPRFGLSAAPAEGYFMFQYGGKDVYGAAVKTKNKNNFIPKIKYSDDGSWSNL